MHALPFQMTLHDVSDEALKNSAVPSHCTKSERLEASSDLAAFLRSRKPNLEWTSLIQEPVLARRGNQGDTLVADRCIQIQIPDSLHEFLLQKPFLYPLECHVVIGDRDGHCRLGDEQIP